LDAIWGVTVSQKIAPGSVWEAVECRIGWGARIDGRLRIAANATIADYIPAEAPVLFLARVASNYDVAAKDHEIWKPVIGHGSKREGWRDVLLEHVPA